MRTGSAGATLVALMALVTVSAQGAIAAPRTSPFAMQADGAAGPAGGAAALPPITAGLPATEKNVELVGKLQLAGGRFPDVKPGQIADLSHKGDYAYLNSWQSESESRCNRGGVFIVDIKDPANPKEVGFVASPAGTFSGEGSQVIALDTPQFKGDLLTINNEVCAAEPDATADTRKGGITLVDVTNPLAPVILAEGFGDGTPSAAVPGVRNSPVHLVHSAFSWQAGQKAYTVMVDNEETADVDIVDITNPRAPQIVNELNLVDPATISGGVVSGSAFGDGVFLHDMVVKEIGGKQVMLASYWDGGYVQLDVTDPVNVKYISDTNFGPLDPIFPAFTPPEGNAHEAEFSHDNRYILAADEDFAPFRGRLTNAVGAGFNFAEPTDAVARIADLPGGRLASESVTFVGRACWSTGTPTPDTIALAPAPADADPATLRVAVIERGVCSFDEKVQGAGTAGYEAFVVFNDAGRPDGDPLLSNAVIDSPDFAGRGVLPGGYLTRADGLAGLFGGAVPAVGATGSAFSVTTAFDGWGYAHLYDAATMAELDSWAVPEARDPRYAVQSFGDLTIHEFATDPVANLAYASYYNAGFRVVSFADGKLTEVGRFIDERGNNFWGVDVMTDKQGGRLILASDRDYGLYVLRYTGPGAVKAAAPAPAPQPPVRPSGARARPASLFTFGKARRMTFRKGKATLRITVPGPGRIGATLKAGIGRKVLTLSRTSTTARRAGGLTLTFRLSPRTQRMLRRTLNRRPSRRTSGVAQVSFTPTGGVRRTRNKSLSIAIRR